MPTETATAKRTPSQGKYAPSRGWMSSSALFPVLVLASVHNFPQTKAFTSESFIRPGVDSHSRRKHQHRAFRVLGLGQQHILHNSQRTSRTRSSTSSKFFVAATTGRSLNSDNENSVSGAAANSSEEEIPWECIVDPTSCCAEHANDHLQGSATGLAAWVKKEEDEDRVTTKDKVSMGATFLTAVMMFSFLLMNAGPGAWRFFLAGGLCAGASHAIPTPIDVVKTRKQVDSDLQELSFMQATQKIVKDEGVGGLLTGLGPTVWGYLLEGSMKFGVYEILKPSTARILGGLAEATSMNFLRSQLIAFMACGIVAGTAASIVLCPMEALRIRLVSEPDFAPKGWIQGGRRMIRREGVLSLWKGIVPQIFKQVPYTVTKNVSFDYFTKYAYRIVLGYGLSINHTTKFTIPLVSALLASILSCISSQPGDTLLSLVSARQGEQRSTGDIAKDIMRSERGIRGFFVGLNPRLYHVGIIVTLQLVLYDFLKRLCGGIATGSVGH